MSSNNSMQLAHGMLKAAYQSFKSHDAVPHDKADLCKFPALQAIFDSPPEMQADLAVAASHDCAVAWDGIADIESDYAEPAVTDDDWSSRTFQVLGVSKMEFMRLTAESIARWVRRVLANRLLAILLEASLPYQARQLGAIAENTSTWVSIGGARPSFLPQLIARLRGCIGDPGTLRASVKGVRKLADQMTPVSNQAIRLRQLLYEIIGEGCLLRVSPGASWANEIVGFIGSLPAERQLRWAALLNHGLVAEEPKISSEWKTGAAEKAKAVGTDEFVMRMQRWLGLFLAPNEEAPEWAQDNPWWRSGTDWSEGRENLLILQGLIRTSAFIKDARLIPSLQETAVFSFQPAEYRSLTPKVGLACVWALQEEGSDQAIEALEAIAELAETTSAKEEAWKAIRRIRKAQRERARSTIEVNSGEALMRVDGKDKSASKKRSGILRERTTASSAASAASPKSRRRRARAKD